MSNALVSHSNDLFRLEQEGFDIEVLDANLLVHHVPYVTSDRERAFGVLVSELSHNGTSTITPGSHEIWFVGAIPCDHAGQELVIINQRVSHDFGSGVIAQCSLSGKRNGEMPVDYYDKITHYVGVLSQYARAIDSEASAITHPARATTPDESVFRYLDAASSRAGISAVTAKLRLDRVAIVGLGGTGSYILDLVSKTPVAEIHLYDDDVMYAHNAFRAPGAASLSELQAMPKKVDYLYEKYDPMHSNIVVHRVRVDDGNVAELKRMSFVFLAVDASPAKRTIVDSLAAAGVPFVDSGMGIRRTENSLSGILRVTASSDGHRSHIGHRISFEDQDQDEYDWNIQTADLNMLNAAMAVVKWKKLFGYYVDQKQEFNSAYTVGRNQMVSGDLTE